MPRTAALGYEIIGLSDGTRRWLRPGPTGDPLYVSEHEVLTPFLMRFDPHELPVAD